MINKHKKNKVEWSTKGVHDDVLRIVLKHVPFESKVLDLACGPGALAKRLYDSGYRVTAANGFPEVFRFHEEIKFIKQDLQLPWTELGEPYDAICAVEIIEHVENPYLFVRNCFNCLKPGGLLVVTTPNASYFSSRLRFLHTGEHEFFKRKSFQSKTLTSQGNYLPGHVHCFSNWMLRSNIESSGFVDIKTPVRSEIRSGFLPFPRRPENILKHIYFRLGALGLSPLMCFGDAKALFSRNIILFARRPLGS